MTNFFGSFIYARHRPDLLGAPADVYTVDTSGVIDVPVEISRFNIVPRDFGYSWSSEDAFKADGSFYGSDHGQGTAVVFGNFPGNVSIDWSFGVRGTGRFLGMFNADATAIIGSAVVDDSGFLPGIRVPLVLTASPSITLTDSQYITGLENLRNVDKALSFVSYLLDIAVIADAQQLSWSEVVKILDSPEFQGLHVINHVIGGVAAGVQAGKDVQKDDWPDAFADIATFATKILLDELLGEITLTGAKLLAQGVPAGGAFVAFGVGGKLNLIIMDDSITRDLHRAFADAYTVAMNHLTSAHPAQAELNALAESLTATVAETLEFSARPGHTVSEFDPGYYLAAHADAVAAVASGAYANAYAYYLTVGIDRGDRPSAASAPVPASDISDLALLRSSVNGFAPLYTGIFDLALGSMPTDGISTVEQSVAQVALAGHGSADATLTALANRLAIDVARNQHYSGTPADLAAGQFPFALSTGPNIADLQAAGAPGFGSFSYYVLSTAPGTTIAQIQTGLHNDVLLANAAVTAATHFGIAEFGGVWVAIIANAGTQIDAPLSEASGSAAINFYGTDGVDSIYLGAHAGTALGGGGSDVLVGSPGNDILNGGPGLDIAMFSGPRSAYTLTHSGIGLLISGPDGVDTVTHIEKLGFSDMTIRSGLKPSASDFSSDDFSDILWRNDNGAASIWDNGAIGGAHVIADAGVVPSSWHIAGNADFEGDGRSDILWRNDNGAVSIWADGQIGGAHIIANAGVVPNSWHIAGTGDFDGNSRGDILWRNDNGAASIWDNGAIGGAHIIANAGVVPNSWHIAGTGDFDADGLSDILWRNDNGAASIWDAGTIGNAHIIAGAGVVPNSWHISGTGDFDGNGHDDILWRNDNGAVSIWDNGRIENAHIIANPGVVPNSWHIAATGDYDGNGHADILWRNDNGAVSIWDNGDIAHAHIIANAGVIPGGWHIA
jgi:hypothetical protein